MLQYLQLDGIGFAQEAAELVFSRQHLSLGQRNLTLQYVQLDGIDFTQETTELVFSHLQLSLG